MLSAIEEAGTSYLDLSHVTFVNDGKPPVLGEIDLSPDSLPFLGQYRKDHGLASPPWLAETGGVNLSGAFLEGSLLVGAKLERADLSLCDLRGALLDGADLTEANLTGANLRGADFEWAKFRRARLYQAKIDNETNLANVDWNRDYVIGEEVASLYKEAGEAYRMLKRWYRNHGFYDIAGEFAYREGIVDRKQLGADARDKMRAFFAKVTANRQSQESAAPTSFSA